MAETTYKVKLLTAMAMQRDERGNVTSRQIGDEIELDTERAASRLVWRGLAEPVGWKPKKCPEAELAAEEVRLYNLRHGIVTPETAADLAAAAATRAEKPPRPDLRAPPGDD